MANQYTPRELLKKTAERKKKLGRPRKPSGLRRRKVAPRINPDAYVWYRQAFENLNQGAGYAMDAFPGLYAGTLRELQGVFTFNELLLIYDAAVRTPPEDWAPLAGRILVPRVEDALTNGKAEEWGVKDPEDFSQKIRELTMFQCCCLETWVRIFEWTDRTKIDLSKWCRDLAKSPYFQVNRRKSKVAPEKEPSKP